MNTIDVVILLCIVFYVVLGFRDGFLRKLFGILGFLGGLILATKFMAPLSDYVKSWLDFSDEASLIIAFFCIFMCTIIIINLFYKWFGQSGSESLKIWSRIAGALLGAAQGIVMASLVLVMVRMVGLPSADDKEESMFYADTYPVAPHIFDYSTRWMPDSKKFFEEVKTKIAKPGSGH